MSGKVQAALAVLVVGLISQSSPAATITVPGDYSSLADALDAATAGDRIEVAPGTYAEQNLVLPAGVALVGMGGDPGQTVIDGQGRGRVLLAESLAQLTHVENFTITRGYAAGSTSYDQSGGAVLCSNSYLRLLNCVFDGNEAEGHGGAIRSSNSTLLIIDCTFTGNIAPGGGGGAIDCSYGSSPLLRNCIFDGNSASWGGALSCRADSSPTVTDCRFLNNAATGVRGYGGAVFSDFQAAPLFTRTTFFGNRARYGGALASFQDAETNLEYCTVVENVADVAGGGLFCNDSSPRITGSLFVFQEGAGIATMGTAVPQITCSDLFGNTEGDWVGAIAGQADQSSNISADPLFCSEGTGQDGVFTLDADSPCASSDITCGPLGAWPVGCEATPAILTVFDAEWSGASAMVSWQAQIFGQAPAFRLTGALADGTGEEWEIPFSDEGGGRFQARADVAGTDSGQRYVFRLYSSEDMTTWSLVAETELVAVPEHPGISDLKAWPNPFNPLTTISFSLGRPQRAHVAIYTLDGRRVVTLASGDMTAGRQEITWDGTDSRGSTVSAGAYIALIEGEQQMQTVKLTLLK